MKRCSECGSLLGAVVGPRKTCSAWCAHQRKIRRQRKRRIGHDRRCCHTVSPQPGEIWTVRDDARQPVRGLRVRIAFVAHDDKRGCRVGGDVVGESAYVLPLVNELGALSG